MTLLTPEQYGDLLVKRREAYEAEHPSRTGFPALLDWFIQDGDEHLVDMDAIDAANRAVDDLPKQPRSFKTAAYWRDRLTAIEARMDAINGQGDRHDTDDRAAYGGIGIRQSARQRTAHGARIDRIAAEWVRLERERRDVTAKLRRAEAREVS